MDLDFLKKVLWTFSAKLIFFIISLITYTVHRINANCNFQMVSSFFSEKKKTTKQINTQVLKKLNNPRPSH